MLFDTNLRGYIIISMEKELYKNNNLSHLTAQGQQGSSTTFPSGLVLLDWKDIKQIHLVKIPSLREVSQQLQIFPEAREYLIKQQKQAKRFINSLNKSEQIYRYIIERKAKPEDQWFWTMITDGVFISPWRDRWEKIDKRNEFILEEKPRAILNVEKAKNFPITELIDFKGRTAKCLFHDEQNSSLYYYPKTNSCYCFGCLTSADSIDIYMKLNNCTFKEAVAKLSI